MAKNLLDYIPNYISKAEINKVRRTKKHTIEEMRDFAIKKGGKCLSTEYINNRTKLEWRCEDGHIWWAVTYSILSGRWCPYCSNNVKYTIEEMRDFAKKKGGDCLSTEYINNKTNLEWRCEDGHIWWAKFNKVLNNGNWCPQCASTKKLNIEFFQRKAKERDGECISTEYFNSRKKLEWRCVDGHTWWATPSSILNSGTWCPKCHLNINEKICQGIFEKIFNDKFPKTRLKWFVNQRRNQLELDGYSEDLKLAFEYQGEQHYKYIPHFHKSRKSLEKRKTDDRQKRSLCTLYGVTLIEIPYWIKPEKMQGYIIKKCKKRNVVLPTNIPKFNYKELDIYSPSKLKQAQEMAKRRGGKCLSTEYINSYTKLKWECKNGHQWLAKRDHIKQGVWCPYCVNKAKHTIEEMRDLAKKKGGKCLSEDYINANTKLQWQCVDGHTWWTTPSCILNNGTWCPKCAKSKRRGVFSKKIIDPIDQNELSQVQSKKTLSDFIK